MRLEGLLRHKKWALPFYSHFSAAGNALVQLLKIFFTPFNTHNRE